ncbi:MAG: hypothetical protein M0C28_15160 [Candidatus Moduliflexus flocculans]|nr:hypothetical protein [Candidatus Moduliflexus flocculans]
MSMALDRGADLGQGLGLGRGLLGDLEHGRARLGLDDVRDAVLVEPADGLGLRRP